MNYIFHRCRFIRHVYSDHRESNNEIERVLYKEMTLESIKCLCIPARRYILVNTKPRQNITRRTEFTLEFIYRPK